MEENNLFYSAKSEVKILVVDDREDNLLSIETILEKDGYVIEKALSGRAALKILLSQHDFTLILMDVQMPDMNGFETASLIYERDKLKHIPIIFITAHNQDEEFMFKGYKMGAVDFIYKPINPELLRFKVSVFAELYRKNHQLLMHERELKAVNRDLQNEIEEHRATEEKIKQLNRQLIENNTELKAINEELDRFAYVASHDLQEPLRKIMLFSDKLLLKMHNTSDPEMSNALERIIRSAERMQTLINDLLKLSRHTQTEDDFENTDLNEVLRGVVGDLEAELHRRQASISIADLPTIWAIPSQARQLFQNLISNSLKFCRHDLIPQIAIRCEKVKGFQLQQFNEEEYEKNYYRITVTDNGIGFDPKYAEDIFVVFKRLHSHHEFEGTGIGLSICKKIVEKHSGFISATGELGKGATFVVAFPEKVTEAVA